MPRSDTVTIQPSAEQEPDERSREGINALRSQNRPPASPNFVHNLFVPLLSVIAHRPAIRPLPHDER